MHTISILKISAFVINGRKLCLAVAMSIVQQIRLDLSSSYWHNSYFKFLRSVRIRCIAWLYDLIKQMKVFFHHQSWTLCSLQNYLNLNKFDYKVNIKFIKETEGQCFHLKYNCAWIIVIIKLLTHMTDKKVLIRSHTRYGQAG